MENSILSRFALSLLLLLLFFLTTPRDLRAQSAPEGLNPGPDIITGDIGSDFGRHGAIWSQREPGRLGCRHHLVQCGKRIVDFFPLPETNHPVIPHNLYRMSGGSGNDERFEQIGQSWVKHAYGSANDNECGFGCAPGD